MRTEPKVIIVVLRRPRKKSDKRTDPLWEFGSFGCTGCHSTNLMNPEKGHELVGARLAFAQGGPDGFKLVHLTPPITIEKHKTVMEARWRPKKMPLKYTAAPLLVDRDGESDFPLLRQFIDNVKWTSWVAKFSSKFRTNRTPLKKRCAKEIIATYERVSSGRRNVFSQVYTDALPPPHPLPDLDRRGTYDRLLKKAKRTRSCK